jgi:membrane-associated phospholipid phosphatase
MESKKSSSSSSSSSISTTRKPNDNNSNDNKNNNNVSSIWTTVYTKIGSTTSICVAGTFFITLCWKRDALMVSFFLGSILNAILGKILKRILKYDRPITMAIIPINGEVIKKEEEEEEVEEDSSMMMKMKAAVQQQPPHPSDNGMPSSHAMSLGFICTFVALLVPSMTLPLLTYAVISLIYRIRVSLHSIDQIIVGSILGIFDGSIWWHLCTSATTTNIVDLISSSGIMNEHGLLPWYLLVVPALIGIAVVGSVERRLGMYFQRSKSSNKSSSGSGIVSTISDENINKLD